MFKLQLALRLGRTVAELDQTLSASEFDLWQAFNVFEPIGIKREDNLFAFLNYMNAIWHGAKDIDIKQFMLFNNMDNLIEEPVQLEKATKEEVENVCVNLKAMFSKLV
ncbi:phage tail assembly protein T [Acinetobacter higginsii]|uniref:phage tail assembly protein T n=1 Tax=Acinetobacter higginsii TaxID=70347 RepID=UPI001F4B843B|nr:hypothetical protein [Acinetobacter higginsii]MCH7381179.1 hypothetical protein [Acinetobacter higginsii]